MTGYCTHYLSSSQNSNYSSVIFKHFNVNPFSTNDNYSRYRNLAAFYQLAQSVLKIGSALAKRVGRGEVGGVTQRVTPHGGCGSWL